MRGMAVCFFFLALLFAPVGQARAHVEIASADDLRALGLRVAQGDSLYGETVYLTCDLENVGLIEPIGNSLHPFEGTFEGGGHEIHGAVVNSFLPCAGLFGCMGRSGEVRDLTLRDCLVRGVRYTGALCGLSAGKMENCRVSGGQVWGFSGDQHSAGTGGLVGCTSGDVIACEAAQCAVVGGINVGGLIGNAYVGQTRGCRFEGAVSGEQNVGGVSGLAHDGYELSYCRVQGSLAEEAGGVCGRAENALVYACRYPVSAPRAVSRATPGTLISGNKREYNTNRLVSCILNVI